MTNAAERGRSFGLGMVRAIVWVAKAVFLALAIYIFFPPFWDAAFAGNLKALHEAPYRAADRARHLWQAVSKGRCPQPSAPAARLSHIKAVYH